MSKKLTILITIFLFIVIRLFPIIAMFVKSLFVGGHFSLESYSLLFKSRQQWHLLFNSLFLAGSTTFITVLLGVPLGILFGKTDLPGKKIFIILFVIPLVIPSYILAIAWFYCLGRSGIVSGLFGREIAVVTSNFLFGFSGTLFVLVSICLPVVIIFTITYLRMINPKLEEAAKLSGQWFFVLRKISIPIIAPGIFLSALIVFILALGEFGVPSSLRFDVFPVESFIQFSAFYDFNAATASAMPLGLIILFILVAERLFLRKKTTQMTIAKESILKISLGKAKPFLFIAVCVFTCITVVVPLAILVKKSFVLWAYKEAFIGSIDSIIRSLLYASAGATLIVVFGFFLGYLLEHRTFRFSYAADSIAIFLFALPGTIIGIGLITLWNTRATNFIYASAVIILFGYIAKYTALSTRFMAVTFSQVSRSMEEAAQILEVGWIKRVWGILVPLVRKGLISTWLVVFIFCLRDLDITMIVYPPAHDTLAVRIFTLMANSPEEIIAALCVIMALITLLPLFILGLVTIKRW